MYTILVVDDESAIRKLLKIELEEDGYTVMTAGDGEEALKKAADQNIDLITLDIRMPKMDGLDFLGRIREINKDLPIIICTAYGTHKQDLAVWGADDYVVKSGDLTELKNKIKITLEKRHSTTS